MSSAETPSSAFPPELEQAIFEIAALSWPRLIPKFMLVAWRVKIWLEPLLYRTIIVGDSPDVNHDKFDAKTLPFSMTAGELVTFIHSKPPTFFQYSVRNLRLAHCLENEEALILSTCSAIENLWLTAQTMNILQFDLPLKRLHCSLHSLFGSSRIDLTHRLFSVMTHLEIFDRSWDGINGDVWSEFTRLSHLTHFALNEPDLLPKCCTLLPMWECLQVLVILLIRPMTGNFLDEYQVSELAHESRFVAMHCPSYLEDWSEGVLTGGDYWSRADNFIAKRKSGEINVLNYYIPDPHSCDDVPQADSLDE
ncbi:hypothetical protein K438DRAFT_2019800 [Mycena galopus ATCC 62051]|nr:hypothetical protein K438DRAFT_2019800 [Mycena galopus ATCC 62051]